MKIATLPGVKTIEVCDFGFASGASRSQMHEWAGLTFIERAKNVVLLGPSRVGKGHLAQALAYRAVMAGIKTRFITAADLMLLLASAKKQERLTGYFTDAVIGSRPLVVDEIGYLPFSRDEANLVFNVVASHRATPDACKTCTWQTLIALVSEASLSGLNRAASRSKHVGCFTTFFSNTSSNRRIQR